MKIDDIDAEAHSESITYLINQTGLSKEEASILLKKNNDDLVLSLYEFNNIEIHNSSIEKHFDDVDNNATYFNDLKTHTLNRNEINTTFQIMRHILDKKDEIYNNINKC